MIEVRPFDSLGHTSNQYVTARHHFCFARYQDPERMNWGRLRVLSQNILVPVRDRSPQPHDNMDILQWVRSGVIGHVGSFGERHRTIAGEVQCISSGAGIIHTDNNPGSRPAAYIELWLTADENGGEPKRGTVIFPDRKQLGRFVTLASGIPADRGALALRSRARVVGARLGRGALSTYETKFERKAYLLPVNGDIIINGTKVCKGDGAAITNETALKIEALSAVELLLIDG